MKFNKLIAKGLALGIILNSTSILSYASTEIPNRYQTLEGEYITIDDSMEGNLEEIEIFGNTIQDENNLEDIQSVGDLYVDEDGRPILDKQGREQYKIDVVSNNSNLVSNIELGSYNDKGEKVNGILDWQARCIEPIYIGDGNTFYSWMDNNGSNVIDSSGVWFYALDKDKKVTRQFNGYSTKYTLQKGEVYILFRTHMKYQEYIDYNYKMMISTSPINQYRPNQLTKITFLIPTPLQKIGDVADKLYWDNSKGRYIIEKNISKEPYNLINSINPFVEYDNHIIYRFPKLSDMKNSSKIYCNRLSSDYHNKTYSIHGDGAYFRIKMPIEINTKELLQDWINEANTLFWYQLENPVYIETNITSKLEIPIYDKKTHIYTDSENGINPDLKVTIDRLPQIAKEAVAQAESDNSKHNIALARMYINMLPESSYKDQLQNQLSDIFSSDMVLDMKITTSNLDVYIKSENILQMSLDTNQISFEDFSGIEDMEKLNAVNLTINSSLPYQLNAYLPMEIQNSDKSVTMDKSILNIKESSESAYQTFINTTDKIVLKDNCSAGNQLTHGVDLKLAGGIAHEKDVYKAIIKLEVEQK